MSININFNVFSNHPMFLSVEDLSDWAHSENLTSYIQVTTPGGKKSKSYTFTKGIKNIFNSHNLGLTCVTADCKGGTMGDLPDGIYTITVLSGFAGIQETKYYLKTDRFEIEYMKLLTKKGTEGVDQEFMNYMTRVKYTLDVAKSFTMEGDFAEAYRFFQEAKTLLNKKTDCKNC